MGESNEVLVAIPEARIDELRKTITATFSAKDRTIEQLEARVKALHDVYDALERGRRTICEVVAKAYQREGWNGHLHDASTLLGATLRKNDETIAALRNRIEQLTTILSGRQEMLDIQHREMTRLADELTRYQRLATAAANFIMAERTEGIVPRLNEAEAAAFHKMVEALPKGKHAQEATHDDSTR